MGKSINGKELCANIIQRKDGRYQARYINKYGKRVSLYGDTLKEVTDRLQEEQHRDKLYTTV